mmetsp:Transcript_19571/g.56330  ORF Transcript_19571/g.56330 Transcript_19571/m.56330 type:complete len:255 (-) Transcript_19571:404-1168(-)
MIRVILRNVQVGLIIAATLLVILAFQRLSLYSVPVLVGNIVHPGQPSGDSADGAAASRSHKELVGHGHAHGQHRIFSTNVIEVGLFKFVVPFRWATTEEDVEEEAVRAAGESVIEKEAEDRNSQKKKAEQNGGPKRPWNGRVGRNRPRHEQPPDKGTDKSHLLGAAPPRVKSKHDNRKRAGNREDAINEDIALSLNQTNASKAIDPLLLLPLNETLVKIESNVTALPVRRLLQTDKRSTTWFVGWHLSRRKKIR